MCDRYLRIILTLAAGVILCCAAHAAVVVDSLSGTPLSRASVLDKRGNVVGACSDHGVLPKFDKSAYPLTVSYIGYSPEMVDYPPPDTVRLCEREYSLPEVVVDSRKHSVLHLVAYVREYSTLSTDYDTVQLFREKTVDFMIPAKKVKHYKGWLTPRVLASESYYRFTNTEGLDSVSSHFRQHFSWSDWVGLLPELPVPQRLLDTAEAVDTVMGRYSPATVWQRSGDDISLDIDVLATPDNRRWVPQFDDFAARDVEFAKFNLKYRFSNVVSDAIFPSDITRISFSIESVGRGRNMRRIFHTTDPVRVDTYAELYVTEREYLTVGEAKKSEKNPLQGGAIGIHAPAEAPELQHSIRSLIARVDGIDYDALKLAEEADRLFRGKKNFDNVIHRGPLLKRIGKTVLDMMRH